MSCNYCGGGDGCGSSSAYGDYFLRNVGRVVTIFTQSGGASGRGFTGLLAGYSNGFIRLVTSLPSAPPNPVCNNGRGGFCGGGHSSSYSRFGSVVIIPCDKIVSFVFAEV